MSDLQDHIHDCWSKVYLNNYRGKAHLFENCKFIKSDGMFQKDMDKYPKGHLEFCSNCKERFQRWLKNNQPSRLRCDRCGCGDTVEDYCMDCSHAIQRRQAQRRF